eukprot:682050-Amphidinium_carterae.1
MGQTINILTTTSTSIYTTHQRNLVNILSNYTTSHSTWQWYIPLRANLKIAEKTYLTNRQKTMWFSR